MTPGRLSPLRPPSSALAGTLADARYAVRALLRSPGLTAAAVACFALGVGANSAMFGIVDALFLRPPAGVHDPDALRRVYLTRDAGNIRVTGAQPGAYRDYLDLRDLPALSGVAGYATVQATLGAGAGAEQVSGLAVSGGYFATLGAAPAVGQFFAGDTSRVPGDERVVVLGHAFWHSRFGADPGVVGRAVRLNGHPFTVVGVARAGFNGVDLAPVDFWAPVRAGPALGLWRDALTGRFASWLRMFVRVRPGVSVAQAERDAAAALARGARDEPRLDPTPAVALGPVQAALGPRGLEWKENQVTLWLAGVSAVVLLVACANVANLLLARGAGRGRELAVRVSLGATRWRVARQLLVEALLLALAGGVGAVAVAAWAGGLARLFPLPPLVSLTGWRVLGFTAALATLAGLAAGLAPALAGAGAGPAGLLGDGARGTGSRRTRLGVGLLVGQIALSAVLLVGAGLFVRSVFNMRALPPGYDVDRVLVVQTDLGPRGLSDTAELAYMERLRNTVAALPGVRAAALTSFPPFTGGYATQALAVPGRELTADSVAQPLTVRVSPEYFDALGLRLVAGRTFGAAERAGGRPAVIVSEALARAVWPGGAAVGQCVTTDRAHRDRCAEVVGVAADARFAQLAEPPHPMLYLPVTAAHGGKQPVLLVRAAGDPGALIPAVRRAAQALDPDAPFVAAKTMADQLAPELLPYRLGATMFTLFGALAALLAAVGLYGVIAYTVVQRTRELGVRAALGARPGDLARLVLGEGMRVALVGVGAGVAAALAAGRLIRGLLYGVAPGDPATVAGVAALLAAVTLLASYLPARRAARADPAVAMRAE